MPIFPILEIESLAQEKDKTRLDALKSYVSGTTAITAIEISPAPGITAIDVTTEGYLDWQYDFGIDIVAGINDKIDFNEGGADLVATLTPGTYTLSDLCTEIATQMDAAGGLTYGATVSADNKITISASGDFSLYPGGGDNAATSVLPSIGFAEDSEAPAASFEGEKIERIARTVSLTVTNADGDETITRQIEVVSELADKLFSNDDRLRKHEPDIMKYLREGRATFKAEHRRAQEIILSWIDENGFLDNLGDKITLDAFLSTEDVKEWATFTALRLIFEGVSNAVDDIFATKAERYEAREAHARERARLRLDLNQDGQQDEYEEVDTRAAVVVRR